MTSNCNYVCLSDLHLGARYSILSSRDEHGVFTVGQESECLLRLAECLRDYIPKVYGDDLPKLILLGDLVDFDFASMTDIIHALEVLIDVLFADDQPAMFQREIILVPGNHDHHLWQSEKDNLFLERFSDATQEQVPYHTTDLFRTDSMPSNFLNQLPMISAKELSIELRYPNWGLHRGGSDSATPKQVIFHHGHYVESLYRLMTSMNQLLADIDDPELDSPNIEELERQNAGWINFFWSSLGASSKQRDNAVWLFDIMQNPSATHRYSKRLARIAADYLSVNYGVSPSTGLYRSLNMEKLLAGVFTSTLGQGFQAERAAQQSILSEHGWEGLQWYLSNPLRQQILSDGVKAGIVQASATDVGVASTETVDTDTTFVFGHTHKPFQDVIGVDGFKQPVGVMNSGGWVVDDPDLHSVQGGAVIFIDENLDTASLRLYQAPVNGVMPEVCAEGLGHGFDASNQLLQRMREQLDPAQWQGFQDSARAAIELRAREAKARFFDPESSEGVT